MNNNFYVYSFSSKVKANKNYVFTILFAAFSFLSAAQTAPPDIQWQKSFGGSLNEDAYSIQETDDGGYITAGFSSSNDVNVTGNHGGADCWIVKLGSTGLIQWQKSLGGSGDDYANSIKKTKEGGYIIAGSSNSNDGDVSGNHGGSGTTDYWVVKLDDKGNIQWQKSFGGSGYDVANAIEQTSDAGYIVAGSSTSNDGNVVSGHHGDGINNDYWILKLDSLGAVEWEQSLGGSDDDVANAIKQTTDGGYIAAGYSASSDGDINGNRGSYDYWIVKLDGSGAKQWQKSFGGSSYDFGRSMELTSDGGCIVAGSSNSADGDVTGGNWGGSDCWVLKLNGSGTVQWSRVLGGSGDEAATCSIKPTSDGGDGYILAASSNSNDFNVSGNHGGNDFWIVKLNTSGLIIWRKSLGGSMDDSPNSILQTPDNGYIIAGLSNSKDGDVSGNHGDYDFWIVKLAADPVTVTNYVTGGNGYWSNPATWLGNTVPPTGASVTIRHNVTANINVVCKNLIIESTAHLTVNPGINITVLH